MRTTGNTILITGGATGIGFALAQAFAEAGNRVIICGRRENKLNEARERLPLLQTLVCDVSKKKQRESLFRQVKEDFPDLNILVNNAGIQRSIDLTGGAKALSGESEIETNFAAPVHLSALFVPLLMNQAEAAIINVSSGLGFVPIAAMPVYCATKAGIHSFTVSLRHQLKNTSVKAFEIVPPMVDTDLGKGAAQEPEGEFRGIPPSEVASATLAALAIGRYDIIVGDAMNLVKGSREDPERIFQQLNQ